MGRRGSKHAIELLEGAYDLSSDRVSWLRGIAGDIHSLFDGVGVSTAIEFDTDGPIENWLELIVAPQLSTSEEDWLRSALGSKALRIALHSVFGPPDSLPTLTQLSQVLADSLPARLAFAPLTRRFEMHDTLVLNANDGTSRGAVFTLPRADGDRARRGHAAIERLLPHVSAALRIRRGIQTTVPDMAGAPHGAELVLDVNGVVRDGEATPSAKDLLRHAVTTRDHARTRQGKADPDAALEAWTALVDGRWSLLDVFERGGRRYVVAVPNVPDVLSATRLGPLERAVFGLLARGRANKAIGYELGLSEGTVAGYIRDLRKKLGHQAVLASARASVSEVVPVPLEATEVLAIVCDESPERVARLARLSSAERAVVSLAVAGQSDKQIAARRAVSPRTVSNQLRSAYQKLGVGSRRGLRAIV